jgi:hypothetical protein
MVLTSLVVVVERGVAPGDQIEAMLNRAPVALAL